MKYCGKIYELTTFNRGEVQRKNVSEISVYKVDEVKAEEQEQFLEDSATYVANKYLNRHSEHLFYGVQDDDYENYGNLYIGRLLPPIAYQMIKEIDKKLQLVDKTYAPESDQYSEGGYFTEYASGKYGFEDCSQRCTG